MAARCVDGQGSTQNVEFVRRCRETVNRRSGTSQFDDVEFVSPTIRATIQRLCGRAELLRCFSVALFAGVPTARQVWGHSPNRRFPPDVGFSVFGPVPYPLQDRMKITGYSRGRESCVRSVSRPQVSPHRDIPWTGPLLFIPGFDDSRAQAHNGPDGDRQGNMPSVSRNRM